MKFFFSLKYLGWDKSLKLLSIIQKRLFKSILVGDLKTALKLQKLILQANFSRLISIRYVMQICINRRLPGIDGKNSLSFVERFELNENLKSNISKWFPQALNMVSLLKNDGSVKIVRVSTISDRSWQYLIKLALEPIHEALFSPRNFGYRSNFNIFDLQNCLALNLRSDSIGHQKRVLILNIEKCLLNYNLNFLIEKIVSPRSIKMCLNRLILSGFTLEFPENPIALSNLSALLANILLDGIESIHDSIHFGNNILYFLKPLENERYLLQCVEKYLVNRGLVFTNSSFSLRSCFEGFDFLSWNFKVFNNKILRIIPSYLNYQQFLFRVKRIINNSNYGSNIKSNKLYPIIKEWRIYHRFSYVGSARLSLYFIKKRAFKVFSKEAKQDFYSIKRLLDKCFYILSDMDKNESLISLYFNHFNNSTLLYKKYLNESFNCKARLYFCIHCGMNTNFN